MAHNCIDSNRKRVQVQAILPQSHYIIYALDPHFLKSTYRAPHRKALTILSTY